ncbi:MAG: type I polyketide synthase [Candidatus Thiosymbion ectosymbiont of Robbea hypermnestra]|nr:type I polyketide synthase [Candidatus Thiosymbion ectosymbiont of Robbea hypermnestra]
MTKKGNTTLVKKTESMPIAIIGMGCRFPGDAETPQKFWKMLCEGHDGVTEVPSDRWDVRRFYDPDPNKPGKTYTKHGAYLRQPIDRMDALFFGISPREAETLDPQQRLILEVTWEALEDAGLVPKQLGGSATGVFIGGFIIDHMTKITSPYNRDLLGTYSPVSFTHTILSARIAYVLDLHGPCMTLDTACSSSLVAFHQACQSLRAGESDLALVGGVNVMHRPEIPISMCKSQLLAEDGRSKSFDARGDGYGRGEGAGIVVLKPLSTAMRDGDSIYAVVRGTGINQDGRTEGITLPNGDAQAALIRQVCERSGIAPSEIAYFEAHGTGTAVGDPTECNALGSVLGQDRSPGDGCFVGSLKANIGHLEAAAGIAGVIKSSLCLTHRQIPPVANLETPNPSIPFEVLGLRLPRKLEPMPEGKRPAYIGINSFGYGGTNAHVILEEAPATEKLPVEGASDAPYLLPLSARSEKALSALARSYLDFLSEPEVPPLRDICYSASVRREHHNHRLALIADSLNSMAEQLESFVKGEGGHLLTGQVFPGQETRPVFVFTGMGPQWWAMGRELLQHEPLFRQVAEECDAIFQRLSGWSILAEMKADETRSRMSETHIAQPANFIVQVGLSALWRSWGIEPAAVVGHSAGDVTASYVAGILGLEDAMLVTYHRSRLQKTVAGQGKMLAVGLAMDEAEDMLAVDGKRVSFAAINSPAAVTLSGDPDVLERIAEKLNAKGIFNRFLQVEVAYHSHIMDGLKDEFREVLSTLQPRAPAVPLYSTVLGRRVEESACDGEYWCNNIRQPVLFARSIENLIDDGHRLFLEVGPHPVLSTSIKECLIHRKVRGTVIASLHREKPERATLREALGNLYTANTPIDFKGLYGAGNYVRLPIYPWQRETYWSESEASIRDRLSDPEQHPLLGQRLTAPTSNNLLSWESVLNNNFLPYLPDHHIEGLVILPGAAYMEIGLAIHKAVYEKEACALEGIRLHRALAVETTDEPVFHVNYDEETREYAVHSRSRDDKSNWTLHATGSISTLRIGDADRIDPDEIKARCHVSMDSETLYARLYQIGLQYGSYFRGIRRLWKGKNETLARIEGHEALTTGDGDYRLHPTLLDACFQSLIALLDDNTVPYVPVSIRQLRFHASPGTRCWSHARLTGRSAGFIDADISLCDGDGHVLVEVKDLRCQALATEENEKSEDWKHWTYEFAWESAARPDVPELNPTEQWLLFSDQGAVSEALEQRLLSHGVEKVIRVRPGATFEREDTTHFRIRPGSREDMRRLLKTIGNGDGRDSVRVVYAWGLDAPTEKDDPTGTADAIACLYLIQALARTERLESRHFFLITRNAQPVHSDERPLALAQAPLVGLVRVAINEYPDIRFHLVDLDRENEQGDLASLMEELLADSPDEEVVLRGTERYVHRLVKTQAQEPEPVAATPELAYELEVGTPGNIESLRFREKQRQVPGPGEIEIEVHAASLNYKDVLKVNRILPEETLGNTFYGDSLGMEAAGVVTSVGEGVKDYRVGDRVVASLPGAFSAYITVPVDAIFLVPKPGNISYEEAVSVPRVFVTAYYGLHYIARLQPGESVLIHAATGGVGMAAIQVACWIGAEIFATVDSPEKSDYLRSMGVEHAMDFRTLDFVDEIMASTGGKGVDVIVSVLPGEIVAKSLTLLGAFGRLIEIGKQDIVNDNRLPLRPFNRSLTFAVVDIDQLMATRPEIFRRMLSEVWGRFMARDFTPLPVKVFPATQIVDAFNHMADSRHIGKIAISMRDLQGLSVWPMAMEKTLFKPDAAYLITGGFGGFGLEVAKWMSALGVRNLVLVGRRGAATEEAKRTVVALEKAGTRVFAASVDIAQESQVARLMDEIGAIMSPLKGVMHAAAVLDDVPITELDVERFSKLMDPKALGAWHLHRQTQDIPLDFFVLFSSISAQIGNASQGNYAAANVFLDALAHHRRASGLPATSIDWGAISEVGMAARDKETGEYLEGMGVKGIAPAQAMNALAYILHWKPIQISLVHADWGKLGQINRVFAASPRFSHLIPKEETSTGDSAAGILRRALQAMEPEEQEERVIALLAGEISKTLRIPADQVSLHHSLPNMGVDSLMAMELRAAIHTQFGVTVTVLELLKGDTIAQMAARLLEKMGLAESPDLISEAPLGPPETAAGESIVPDNMGPDYVEGEI